MDALTIAFHREVDRLAGLREIGRQRREASDRAVEAFARRTVVLDLKARARRYDRVRDLSNATGVYAEYCHDMTRSEAIRRLTDQLAIERENYRTGYQGALTNTRSARALIQHIRAALLCERLARARDHAQARADEHPSPASPRSYAEAV